MHGSALCLNLSYEGTVVCVVLVSIDNYLVWQLWTSHVTPSKNVFFCILTSHPNPWGWKVWKNNFSAQIWTFHSIYSSIFIAAWLPPPWGWRIGKDSFSMHNWTFNSIPSKLLFLQFDSCPSQICRDGGK